MKNFLLLTMLMAELTLRAQPVITNQPTDQTALNGGTALFTVGVSNFGPVTYQWRFGGTNLPNNIISTVAGKGVMGYSGDHGAATNAKTDHMVFVAVDAGGNLFFAELNNNRIRKVDTNGIITTVAGNGAAGYFGDGGAATNAKLNAPVAVVVDSVGNLFIADSGNGRIRMVNPNGLITTVAGGGSGGDGGAATNASLSAACVAVDGSGNLFIADGASARIRKVDAGGIITTVAGNGTNGFLGDGGLAINAELNRPYGVAVDKLGNVFVGDTYNRRVRKVDTNGVITTFAGNGSSVFSGDGGAATNAGMLLGSSGPTGLFVDPHGNVCIPNFDFARVRLVDTNGIISTVAGSGGAAYSGDGGAATNAGIYLPSSATVDSYGNLFVGTWYENRIRKVTTTQGPGLFLHNISAGNAGNYSVVITGASGSVTSSVVVLKVILPNLTASVGGVGAQLQLSGVASSAYVLQAATNLTPPVVWQSIITNLADTNGNWSFTDTNAPAVPATFYRVTAP